MRGAVHAVHIPFEKIELKSIRAASSHLRIRVSIIHLPAAARDGARLVLCLLLVELEAGVHRREAGQVRRQHRTAPNAVQVDGEANSTAHWPELGKVVREPVRL